MSILLGGAAGVMLAATSFSLIVPGIEHGNILWPGFGVYTVAIGILSGAFCLDLVDRFLPHEHFILGHEGPSSKMKKIWLFIIAITIHNFPEGLAVGVGFGGGDTANGTSLAFGIGLQNIPEGLAVALPLLGLGYSRIKVIGIATFTGLVESVGGLLGLPQSLCSIRFCHLERPLPLEPCYLSSAMKSFLKHMPRAGPD